MKTNKLLRSVWLMLALVLVLGVTASAFPSVHAETYGDWTYSVSSGTATITGYTGTSANVTVPASIGDYSVTAIGNKALQGNTVIKTISFPNTLTTIGEKAFSGCSNLEEVTLPAKLANLGNYSFENCTKLSKLTINSVSINNKDDYKDEPFYNAGSATDGIELVFGDGVTRVPAYLFYPDSGAATAPNIKSVSFSDTVTEIGRNAFYECTALKEVNFGTGLTTIDRSAFNGCTGLKNITLPNSVTSLETYAFYKCSGLKSIKFSASLTTIGDYAFASCTGLTEITLPKKLTSLGNYAFKDCTNIETITINSVSINDKDDYQDEPFYNVGGGTEGVELIFGEGVTRVPAYLFYAYSGASTAANLTSITFSDTITEIGRNAFNFCTALNELNFGTGLTSIGRSAFNGCTGLKNVTLPNSVTSLGEYAFYKCSGLKDIKFPTSLTSIGDYAFGYCTGLTEINLPKKLTYLGNYSFRDCTNIATININSAKINNKDDYQDEPFFNVGSATEGVTVNFNDGCTYIPAYLFYPYSGASSAANLVTINIADSVTEIGRNAFNNCTNLSDVNFGTGLTTIGRSAFNGCTSLKEVVLPENVTSIGDYVFHNSGLTSIKLNDALTTIGEYAFQDCTGLTEITLPANVTSLGNYAFKNCTYLADITINSAKINNKDDYQDEPFYNVGSSTDGVTVTFGDGCTRVPSNLFYAYSGASAAANLKTVILSDTVASIGDSAFENCTTLESVTLGKGLTTIEKEAFKNCTGLAEITILHYVTTMGKNVFNGCENTLTIYGYLDTAAHAHANEYNIKFVALADPLPTNPFLDVRDTDYFYDSVLWAVQLEITNGYGNDYTFGPAITCTRGQVVTFLWRAKGCPEPTSTTNPFQDVTTSDYFYKAVLWAVEQGITNGYGNDYTFNPSGNCTRGQVVTFLWRAQGNPNAGSSTNPFGDVSSIDYFYAPVLWALNNGVTTGLTAESFGPNSDCSRGQIVTFLYRALK